MDRPLLSVSLLLLSLLAGLVAGGLWWRLPPGGVVTGLVVGALFLLLLYIRRPGGPYWLCCACVLFGLAGSTAQGLQLQRARLPESLANSDWQLLGRVVGLPERTERGERFAFQVERVLQGPATAWQPELLRLTHYRQRQDGDAAGFGYRPGDHWQLQVRLKPPRGSVNPYGFDFEAWLLAQGYQATGYVRDDPAPYLQRSAACTEHWHEISRCFDQAAFHFLQWAQARVSPEHRALFAALTVGYGKGFSRQQWDRLRDTGTIHLVVVSGMHISLLASAGYLLLSLLARLVLLPLRILPAPVWGAFGAALMASAYAGLSGFTVPVQRAWVMVLCGLAVWCLRRQVGIATGFLLACVLVLLLEPLAFHSSSFWLSFGAVAILLFVFSHRHYFPQGETRIQRALVLWWRVQFVLTLGMIPLLATWVGSLPTIGFVANLLAVPWLTVLVFPLAVFSWGLDQVWPTGGGIALALAEKGMDVFWALLAGFQQWNHNFYFRAADNFALPAILLSVVAVITLLSPVSCFSRRSFQYLVGACCLVPLFIPLQEKIPTGEFRLTVMDVGQGLATLVETRDSVLVYDTGEKYSDQFDNGRDLLANHLRRRGHHQIDYLVVSHGDSDHAGGSAGLLSELPVDEFLSGEVERVEELTKRRPRQCHRGQAWREDGVTFRVLSPGAGSLPSRNNNRSCVLLVSNGREAVLLTGDIEASLEAQLLAYSVPGELRASVLLVPHHGSKTSSSAEFLVAVRPRHAIASVGYHSRYGHPHPQVEARYRSLGIALLRTDRSGALVLESLDGFRRIRAYRTQSRHYWHRAGHGVAARRDLL